MRPLSVLGARGLFDEFVGRLVDPSWVAPSAALNGERSAVVGASVSAMIMVFCARGPFELGRGIF